MLTGYRKMIVNATGCGINEVGEVEEAMRVWSPTLDHLSVGDFCRLAREAYAVVLEFSGREIH